MKTTTRILILSLFTIHYSLFSTPAPLMSSAAEGIAPLALPALQVSPLGAVATTAGQPKRDLLLFAQNANGTSSLYLAKYLRDDANGTPVFNPPATITSTLAGTSSGTVFQTPDNSIHALFITGGTTLIHATLDTSTNTLTQKSSTALPTPPALNQFPTPTYTSRLAAIQNSDNSIDLVIELNDGVPAHTTDSTTKAWRPYDAALIYSGNYSYSALVTTRITNLDTTPALSAPVLATPRQRELLFTSGSLSPITLDPAYPNSLVAGSRFGNLFYLQSTTSNPAKFSIKKPITSTNNLLLRNPAATPAPIAFPDTANPTRNNIITASEGPLQFYKFTGNFTPNNTPVFNQPVPVLQTNSPLNAGTLPAITAYDWDNDGKLDIIAGTSSGHLLFFKNTGTTSAPQFLPPTRIQADGRDLQVQAGYSNSIAGMTDASNGYLSPVIIDWNQDGTPDVIVGDASGTYSIFVNRGTPGNPALEPQKTIFCEGLPLHGMWRVRPAAAHVGNTTYLVTVDDLDKLHLYQRIDDYNVRQIYTTTVTVSAGNGTLTGRCNLELYDYDNDGKLDIIIGASTANSVPSKTTANTLTAPAVLYLRNTGTTTAPTFAAPVKLTHADTLQLGTINAPGAVLTPLGSTTNTPNLLISTETGQLYLYNGTQLTPAPAAR